MGDAIIVKNVSKTFKLPHEKHNSLKSLLISRVRGGKPSYERQQALDDVSFQVNEGDFFAIVGRNGSGKSTMLKMLAGIYSPTEGEIHVNGRLTPFIELGVGFNADLSGRENVFLNGALLGFSRKEMDEMYDDIVEFAELERFMDQKLKNYSSGMQVRLAFSIAIRAESDILLLDEVLAVGDSAFQQKCFNYFEKLKLEGKTVVFVSHDMLSVKRFCNRAVYIRDGKLIHDGTPDEVADFYIEDNVRSMTDEVPESSVQTSKVHQVSGDVKQTQDKVILSISYKSKTEDDMYVAFSLVRDGNAIAELSTPLEMKLIGNGKVTYELDITLLNPGIYELPIVLCRKQNRELLSVGKSKNRFIIKGKNDPTHSGGLRLEHNWKQSK